MRRRERKSEVGRPMRRWKDSTEVDVKGVDWRAWTRVNFPQVRDMWRAGVNTVRSRLFPLNSWKFLTRWGTVELSRRALLESVER